MIKKIKNADGTLHTWVGQEIQPGDYYQIQPIEEFAWANNSDLLTSISIGHAIVNDGTNDLSDLNTAINYLKSNLPKEVVTQFEKRDKTIKLAHAKGSVDENGMVTLLLKIPGSVGSGDGRWLSSGTAFFDVHTPGDKILGVYFTDEDNILGQGSGFVVGSYTDDDSPEENRGWAIPPIGWVNAEAIGGYGFAPAGFYIKIIAKKEGDSPAGNFYCNLEWGKIE